MVDIQRLTPFGTPFGLGLTLSVTVVQCSLAGEGHRKTQGI